MISKLFEFYVILFPFVGSLTYIFTFFLGVNFRGKGGATYQPAIDISSNVPDEHLLEIPDRPTAPVILSLSSDYNSFLFFDIEKTSLGNYP